jgi:ABC-type dipeptide/oligopeptide/nickel transport system permease component
MIAYITRRLMLLPVVVFLTTLIIFLLVQLLPPGVRVALYVQDNPAAFRDINQLIRAHGLDKPIWEQYWNWISSIAHGNLGWSRSANMSVANALRSYLPATIELTLMAIIPLVLGGIWLGTKSAVYHNRWPDHITRVMAITGWSLPTFVAGLILLMVFYGYLGLLQPGRLSAAMTLIVNNPEKFTRYTGMNTLDALLNGPNWAVFWDSIKHLILPAITLAYVSWAMIVRIMRSSMLNVLREDYTTTARAKGLTERVVINKHARRNALIPVVTISGIAVGWLLGGVVITETIFNYFGIGWWFVRGAANLDIPAVLGFTIFNSTLWVMANLAVDVLYSYIDPRVRLS